MTKAYLSQVEVILLHIHQMVPDQKFHRLHIVFVLITTFYQTPENTRVSHTRGKHTVTSVTIKGL